MQLDDIALPDDLIWIDELEWTPVQQSEEHSLTGALIVQTGVKQAGRPITLRGDSDSGWITRQNLLTLYAKLTGTPPFILTLNDNRTFNVRFRHQETPIGASPVFEFNNPGSSDQYSNLIIRLIAV